MRFKVGDLVKLNDKCIDLHRTHGGYTGDIEKVGIVIKVRDRRAGALAKHYENQLITVKFPNGEPEVWLGTDFYLVKEDVDV